MKTKRITKCSIGSLIALLVISILCLCLLGGCGMSEKFAGTWIGVGMENDGNGASECYVEATIEKNGDKNYIVNIGKENPYFVSDEKKIFLIWPKPDGKLVGTVQDNVMKVQTPMADVSLTYIEKDGSLQLNYTDPMSGKRNTFSLQKVKDSESDKMMDTVKDKLQELYKSQNKQQEYEMVVVDKNETREQVEKEHPVKPVYAPIVLNHKEYNPWENVE